MSYDILGEDSSGILARHSELFRRVLSSQLIQNAKAISEPLSVGSHQHQDEDRYETDVPEEADWRTRAQQFEPQNMNTSNSTGGVKRRRRHTQRLCSDAAHSYAIAFCRAVTRLYSNEIFDREEKSRTWQRMLQSCFGNFLGYVLVMLSPLFVPLTLLDSFGLFWTLCSQAHPTGSKD